MKNNFAWGREREGGGEGEGEEGEEGEEEEKEEEEEEEGRGRGRGRASSERASQKATQEKQVSFQPPATGLSDSHPPECLSPVPLNELGRSLQRSTLSESIRRSMLY